MIKPSQSEMIIQYRQADDVLMESDLLAITLLLSPAQLCCNKHTKACINLDVTPNK